MKQGRRDQAEELFVQVMETRKRVLGAEHPDTQISMTNLMVTYIFQDRWDEANELAVAIKEIGKAKVGADYHPSTADPHDQSTNVDA